jgi:hypothetical protein
VRLTRELFSMTRAATRLTVAVLLLALGGCSCDRSPALISARDGGRLAATRDAAGERSADAARGDAGVPESPVQRDPRDLAVPYVARLRQALVASDRERFASLLSYPVRVNTRSRCTAQIDSSKAFVAHFDAIVKGGVETGILSSRPPFFANWQGVSLDRGSVWLDSVEDDSMTVIAFNSDAWRLPDLACWAEPDHPLPVGLSGAWRVSSVAIMQGGQLDPRSPTTWIGRRVELDLKARRAVVDRGRGPSQRCVVGRAGEWDSENFRALGASLAGLAPDGRKHYFIDLECGSGQDRYVERVDILGESALAIVGDDKYLLVLRRESKAAPGARRVLKPDEACGEVGHECPKGHVCTAMRNSSDELVETCRPID